MNEPFNVRYAAETIPVFARWFGSWQLSVQRLAFSSPEITRLYDRAAPRWGRTLDRLGYPGAYETLLRRVLSEEAPGVTGAQLRVMDCGVGTGALSCALARVLPAPFKLDAIDISPRMLERASSSLRDTALEVSLRHGDVRKLPYGDGVFDLVMIAHVLEHLVDPSVALRCPSAVFAREGFRLAHTELPPSLARRGYRPLRQAVCLPSRLQKPDPLPGRRPGPRVYPEPRPIPEGHRETARSAR